MTDATVGHNSDPNTRIEEFVDRVNALEHDKRGLMQDIRDVLAEAKHIGLNPKVIRAAVKRQFENADQVAQREAFEAECAAVFAKLDL